DEVARPGSIDGGFDLRQRTDMDMRHGGDPDSGNDPRDRSRFVRPEAARLSGYAPRSPSPDPAHPSSFGGADPPSSFGGAKRRPEDPWPRAHPRSARLLSPHPPLSGRT